MKQFDRKWSGWFGRVLPHVAVTILSFAVGGIFVWSTFNISFLSPIATAFEEFSITDIYYQMHNDLGDVSRSNLITIVDMTELTSRQDIAKAIDEIESHNPAVLGIDIVFEGLKEDTIGDNMMMDVAEKYSNTVYAYRLMKYVDGQYTEEVHSFFSPFIPVVEGFTNFERKLYGGIKREVTIGQAAQDSIKPSFALTVANMYAGQEVMPLEDKQIEINFMPTDFCEISYREISQNPELIMGRIVFLGATKDSYDMHYTPLGKMAGIELMAYSVETILHQKEVKTIPQWLLVIFVFFIVLLAELVLSLYKRVVDKNPILYVKFSLACIIGFMTLVWILDIISLCLLISIIAVLVLSVVLGHLLYKRLRTSEKLISFLLSSNMAVGFFMFILMMVYFTMTYILFYYENYSISLVWPFSAMACLDPCKEFYKICTEKKEL